jgi:Asp-tRNA(Asn)/Glu-tRNA(Gln) amidotransferase A subunit family amidase
MTETALTGIAAAADAMRAGKTTSVDLVEAALEAIARDNPRVNAFITVRADQARAGARAADADRARGIDRGPLHGIPISLKDLIDEQGVVTTAASRVLADRVAAADAPIVTRLRAAGAVVIGRTNLHEFALGTTSEDTAFGPVRNPREASRSAGGSSGGSAAAVALGMGFASIGTDTGGSIRIPAAACGVVGLKPTRGEVPTDGVIPLSPSFDHVGPLTTSVRDAAIVWSALCGLPHTLIEDVRVGDLRLGRLTGYFDAPLAPEVRAGFIAGLERLRAAGAAVTDAELARAAEIPAAYVPIVLSEAEAWHRQYLETKRELYTPTVGERLASGRSIAAEQVAAAREVVAAIGRNVDAALTGVDALVLPTLPIVAPPLGAGDLTIEPGAASTPVRAAMLKHTQPFNFSGHPAISIPLPVTGLPVGLQIVGRRGNTPRLLAIAAACEKILGRA